MMLAVSCFVTVLHQGEEDSIPPLLRVFVYSLILFVFVFLRQDLAMHLRLKWNIQLAGLDLAVFLPPPPKGWDYRCAPQCMHLLIPLLHVSFAFQFFILCTYFT